MTQHSRPSSRSLPGLEVSRAAHPRDPNSPDFSSNRIPSRGRGRLDAKTTISTRVGTDIIDSIRDLKLESGASRRSARLFVPLSRSLPTSQSNAPSAFRSPWEVSAHLPSPSNEAHARVCSLTRIFLWCSRFLLMLFIAGYPTRWDFSGDTGTKAAPPGAGPATASAKRPSHSRTKPAVRQSASAFPNGSVFGPLMYCAPWSKT
mmetsp:Transcript_21210/g.42474  ORF Transcript_21210/g.42474 Transcript_21210/m.42474 type:complete len:204 (+) Transcript_21210:463-1074(+)